MLMANLRFNLQHLALAALDCVGAARIGKLKRRGAPELEFQVCASTLVNVDFTDLAARETDRGDGMDGFAEVQCCETFRCRVPEASDGEGAGELGEAAERGPSVGGLALLLFKSVVHCKRNLTAEGKGQALANAEVGAVFKWRGNGCVVDTDGDAGTARGRLERAASRVTDFADRNG